VQIKTIYNTSNAHEATGIAVVIDVFRAFSTACAIMSQDVEKLLVAEHVQELYQLKDDHPDIILVGERDGIKLRGFDYANSPIEIMRADLHGKTVALTTSAGTRGMLKATNADEIITGAFVNAHAIISHIQSKSPEHVSLVCTGAVNEHIKNEDTLCAQYIEQSLLGNKPKFMEMKEQLRKSMHAMHFFDEKVLSHPEEDFDACLKIDSYDFVLKAQQYSQNLLELVKVSSIL
jgi:2-phosphosulfolactate phosphatase